MELKKNKKLRAATAIATATIGAASFGIGADNVLQKLETDYSHDAAVQKRYEMKVDEVKKHINGIIRSDNTLMFKLPDGFDVEKAKEEYIASIAPKLMDEAKNETEVPNYIREERPTRIGLDLAAGVVGFFVGLIAGDQAMWRISENQQKRLAEQRAKDIARRREENDRTI